MCEVPKTLLATLLRSLALHAALPSVGFHGCYSSTLLPFLQVARPALSCQGSGSRLHPSVFSLEEKELAMEDPSSERAKSAHRVHFEQLQAAESAT